ncbi:MAG: VWA domain-containing protein [Microscillaceae bacterium]|nr:VWA domain-containing protein [Microscillaceae bacterium]
MDLQWYYQFDGWKYTILTLFGLAYLLYIIRILDLAQRLGYQRRWVFIKLPIRILYFSSLMIALMGPSFGYGKKYIEAIGKDIFIAIDLSKSMDTQDVPPSRIEKLKFELQNLIKILFADRIGLIIFAEDAYMHCPLTYDKAALDLFLQNIHTGLVSHQGTDFYPPLKMAIDRLKDTQNSLTQVKSRILILASDGEDFGEEAQSILEEYQNNGVRVFTLGIGTAQGGNIPHAYQGYILDEKGKPVVSRLNYKNLESLSEQTGGQFFEISKVKNDMSQLIKTIQEIKGERRDIRTLDVSYNKYEYFLWIALALIFLDFVVIVKVLKL